MTRGSFTCFGLIQAELEFQYKGKISHSRTESLFLILHIVTYVIYIVLPFRKGYSRSLILQKQFSHLVQNSFQNFQK